MEGAGAGGGASALSAYLSLEGASVAVVDRHPEPAKGRLPDGRDIPEIGKAVTELTSAPNPADRGRLDGGARLLDATI